MHQNYEAAIQAHVDGKTIDWILSTYSIPKTTFYRWLSKLEVPKRLGGRAFSATEIDQINELYSSGVSITELIKKFSSSFNMIKSVIKEVRTKPEAISLGLRVYTDAQVDEAVAMYGFGLTSSAVGQALGMSEAAVLRFLKLRGVKAREIAYECNEHYFDELDTEQKLYWFGFLAADGRLSLRNYASSFLECNLGMKDKPHLELLSKHMGYTGPIRDKTVVHSKTGKIYTHANFKITRINIVDALRRWGLKDIKAGDVWPLTVFDDEQIRLILRGYFDGDGSIYKDNRRALKWHICGPHKEPLEYLMSRCSVVGRFNAIGKSMKYRVGYSGNKIVPRICEWLYRDATVWLPRKRAVIEAHLK